jgi:hypothetical protein
LLCCICYWVYITAGLKGKYVGAEDQGNGIWRVFYRDVFLGYFNSTLSNETSTIKIYPATSVRGIGNYVP